jgi:hypothetical protein
MRHLAIALAALLAFTAVGRAEPWPLPYEPGSLRYEWSMGGFNLIDGQAQVTLAPGGDGLVAEFSGATATLTLAPSGTASVPLGDSTFTVPIPTVLPMATLTAGTPQAGGGSFRVGFDVRLRLTDLGLNESAEYLFHAALFSQGGGSFLAEYDYVSSFSQYLSNGRIYTASPTWDGRPRSMAGTVTVYGHDPNVTVPGLPEPSSFVLLALGGLGLLGWRHRRRPS